MKFGIAQKIKFGSKDGSYSIVTRTEGKDSQITATDNETDLLIKYFGKENIARGATKINPVLAAKQFRKYPSGETISLNLVFPKKSGSELRLYVSISARFRPRENDIWFIFLKGKDIWIGAMSEAQWRNENSLLIYDTTDGSYQDSIEELTGIKRNKLKARDVFARDGKLALASLENADFKCESNPKHQLFISRYSKRPFLEAHHLLPMALQKTTSKKLDTLDNIFCLCSYCHRAIHHAENAVAKNIIDALVEKRPAVLDILKIDKNEIHKFYSLETIMNA